MVATQSPPQTRTTHTQMASTLYIIGSPHKRLHQGQSPVLIVLTTLPNGELLCRSTARGAFNHLYPRGTSMQKALKWIDLELSQPLIIWSREEVKELLANSQQMWPQDVQPIGYLHNCDMTLSPLDQAERVLLHLERSC